MDRPRTLGGINAPEDSDLPAHFFPLVHAAFEERPHHLAPEALGERRRPVRQQVVVVEETIVGQPVAGVNHGHAASEGALSRPEHPRNRSHFDRRHSSTVNRSRRRSVQRPTRAQASFRNTGASETLPSGRRQTFAGLVKRRRMTRPARAVVTASMSVGLAGHSRNQATVVPGSTGSAGTIRTGPWVCDRAATTIASSASESTTSLSSSSLRL